MDLDDRPREDDGPRDAEEPAAAAPFNPLYAIGGAVIAVVCGLMALSGLLVPALVFGGALVLFVLVQVAIFRLFPPPKA